MAAKGTKELLRELKMFYILFDADENLQYRHSGMMLLIAALQNSLNCTLKKVKFTACKLYLNEPHIKLFQFLKESPYPSSEV